MKILQVITDTDRRGAQTFAVDLGIAMQATGNHVETVALAPGSQSSPLHVETLGATRRGPRTLRALRSKMSGFDITIAHGSSTLIACAIAGFPSHRFVYRQISDSRFWANTRRRRLRTALLLRRASHIVALSGDAKETLIAHLWARHHQITVIPNAVPRAGFRRPTSEERSLARRAFELTDEAFVVVYIGALVPEKGVDIAIEAVAELRSAEVLIAGGGPDRVRLEALASEQLPGRFRMIGAVAEPFDVYAAADVMVLPSKGGDSMPATLIEAGLCSLPTISTPIGSIEDVVVDGKSGLIVAPNDAGELRQAIEKLINNKALARSMGDSAAIRCASFFEIEPVSQRWLDVLRTSLGRSEAVKERNHSPGCSEGPSK